VVIFLGSTRRLSFLYGLWTSASVMNLVVW
jgi:hypothetical protein